MKIKNDLKHYMNTVPYGQYSEVKRRIIKACFVTEEVWANWMKGRTSIPYLAKEKINEIAGRDIFVTGELEFEEN
jgi:hypothetical protein